MSFNGELRSNVRGVIMTTLGRQSSSDGDFCSMSWSNRVAWAITPRKIAERSSVPARVRRITW
jgi:hypothetical protein